MRTITTVLLAVFLASACAGAGDDTPDDDGHSASDAQSSGAQAGEPDDHADSEPGHGHGTAEPGEGQTLLAIMQKLGVDMTLLTHGIMTEDTALVARSAADVAAHPDIAPEEVERIHAELGSAMAEFERLDAEVHEASVALSESARTGRFSDVLDRLHQVQRGCVDCHTQFRERLRTNPGS